MSFEIVTLPCLSDNYAFLVHNAGKTAVVDAPEAGPILDALSDRGWSLDEIWLTHHHDDHIQGVSALRARFPSAVVRGNASDADRLPPLDAPFDRDDSFDFGDSPVTVMFVPGHTVEHVALHVSEASALFSGDSLMALGCGRVFEGTMKQMWESLSRLAALPDETMIYSGHEYTEANGRFALTIEPASPALLARMEAIRAARADGHPTVPSRLDEEQATNPFLRAGLSEVKELLNMSSDSDADVFAEIRRRKNAF